MSVFGGDSWAREAQPRKRRVNDLVVERLDSSSYKMLSNGKFACIICPYNPVFDTPLTLSMHCKGSRHRAAMSKLKEKELTRQYGINKRIAYSESPNSSLYGPPKVRLASKLVIEHTKEATPSKIDIDVPWQKFINGSCNTKYFKEHAGRSSVPVTSSSVALAEPSHVTVVQRQQDYREYHERMLKFIEAGWKRDGHGRWFRDENVEFDSDEEDPNVALG